MIKALVWVAVAGIGVLGRAQEIDVVRPLVTVSTNEVVVVTRAETNVVNKAWVRQMVVDMTPRASGRLEVARVRVWAEGIRGYWDMPAAAMNAALGTNEQRSAWELIYQTATLATGVGDFRGPPAVGAARERTTP